MKVFTGTFLFVMSSGSVRLTFPVLLLCHSERALARCVLSFVLTFMAWLCAMWTAESACMCPRTEECDLARGRISPCLWEAETGFLGKRARERRIKMLSRSKFAHECKLSVWIYKTDENTIFKQNWIIHINYQYKDMKLIQIRNKGPIHTSNSYLFMASETFIPVD